MYTIIETHAVYSDNKLQELAVLWESNEDGSVRATYANTKPIGGYEFLRPDAEISQKLIQKVAGAGMNLRDDQKKKYFPGKRNWER
jgi:hypothetical protein